MWLKAMQELKTAVILLIIFTLLTGLLYPATITVISQLLFPWKANGSFIEVNGKTIGSILIGQNFTDPKYFWPRPSATRPFPYNAERSLGSNMGPSNPEFLLNIKNRVTTLKAADPQNSFRVPVDLVTASGSGLDPDISPLAAFYQISRIATARGIPNQVLEALVQHSIQTRSFGILGEPRVNVLQLNLALDNLTAHKEQ